MAETKKLNFSNATVLVVGDVMLDRYWYGPVSRISPEAPVPVVQVNQIEERPGGAGNVALNLAALGVSAIIVGVVGDDEAGKALHSKLQAAKIETHLHMSSEQSTVTKLRVLSRHQQLIRLDFEENLSINLNQEAFIDMYTQALADVDVVLLSDYAKGTLTDPQRLIEIAKAHNKSVLVDPKSIDLSIYQHATMITPNMKEFEAVVGQCADEKEIAVRAQKLCEKHDFQAILVTRGEKGMTLITKKGEEYHIPTLAREVYDVTGAGDTVIATLAGAVASGASFEQAMVYANTAAGIVVAKMGAATVSMPELKMALLPNEDGKRGILNEEQLLQAVEIARAKGRKVVMSNGCFDVLHAGHVHYLNKAKENGDRLIVAVNSDESVTALKGPDRPVNSLDRRMAVLAGLEAVDWVVPFGDETPCRLIELIKPDILIKGGDYGPDEVVGASIVKAYGGEVKVLGLVKGLSSSATLSKLKKRQEKGD